MTPADPNADPLADLRRRWEEEPGSRLFLQLAEEYRRDGRREEALQVLQRGLEAHPQQVSGLVSLGRLHLEMGQAAQAATALEKAVSIDPTNLAAMKLAVEAYLAQGDRDNARQRLELYKLLNAGDPEVGDLEDRVEGRAPAAPPQDETPGAASGTGGRRWSRGDRRRSDLVGDGGVAGATDRRRERDRRGGRRRTAAAPCRRSCGRRCRDRHSHDGRLVGPGRRRADGLDGGGGDGGRRRGAVRRSRRRRKPPPLPRRPRRRRDLPAGGGARAADERAPSSGRRSRPNRRSRPGPRATRNRRSRPGAKRRQRRRRAAGSSTTRRICHCPTTSSPATGRPTAGGPTPPRRRRRSPMATGRRRPSGSSISTRATPAKRCASSRRCWRAMRTTNPRAPACCGPVPRSTAPPPKRRSRGERERRSALRLAAHRLAAHRLAAPARRRPVTAAAPGPAPRLSQPPSRPFSLGSP